MLNDLWIEQMCYQYGKSPDEVRKWDVEDIQKFKAILSGKAKHRSKDLDKSLKR